MPAKKPVARTEWFVAPGYEPVVAAWNAGKGSLGKGGGAFCAYVDGVPVVDIWGGTAHPGQPWQADTTTVLMSATKGLAMLCMQMLVDRGQISLDTKVASVWPEFAQNGKQDITLRQICNHTAGVIGYKTMSDVVRHDGTGWDDYEAIAAGLAAAAPAWTPGTDHGYHALTVGWLQAEILRRVDGRTMGTFFAEEIAQPLGLECWIGTPEEEFARKAFVHNTRTDHMPSSISKAHAATMAAMRSRETLIGQAFLATGTSSGIDVAEHIFNTHRVIGSEFPAGGGTATARALARLWALMANEGELDGVRLLSPGIVKEWSVVNQTLPDACMAELKIGGLGAALTKTKTPRTIGYLGNGEIPGLGGRFGPNMNTYGAEGLGGQYIFGDPESKISVGYIRSELALIDFLHTDLTNAVYDCAKQLGHHVVVTPQKKGLGAAAKNALGGWLRKRIEVPAA